jgi:hypothetical protein
MDDNTGFISSVAKVADLSGSQVAIHQAFQDKLWDV